LEILLANGGNPCHLQGWDLFWVGIIHPTDTIAPSPDFERILLPYGRYDSFQRHLLSSFLERFKAIFGHLKLHWHLRSHQQLPYPSFGAVPLGVPTVSQFIAFNFPFGYCNPSHM
jgi:hypothetical protein